MSQIWLWCALHVFVAALGTWLLRRYALHRRLLDQPGERRSHVVATPRGGGMAIVAAILLGCSAASLLWPEARVVVGWFAIGLILVAGVGWWDDHRPLSARLRFAIHLAASASLGSLVIYCTGDVTDGVLSAVASVVLINVWNFMDGINGLAASQAALAALAFAAVVPAGWSLAGLAVAAACLGFLPFNFPRARIFLGDGGSGALGYVLAALLALSVTGGQLSWWIAWMPLTAFLVDAGFTLVFRMFAGQRWWEPHAQHVYQRLARQLETHVPVTAVYFAFSLTAVCLYVLTRHDVLGQQVWAGVVWGLGASASWYFLRDGLRNS
ncbi:MraY family glycosyltransferase [Xanthomonas vesicatoria]|uniref:UDP-N-acetylmuramyl pentapeptide phosphotransferase/UDP-N-acetylglucosamine-1-phosphate transferase n=1 Tax=Xanthomonas vesicatoria ATCC 35937 TaxID=925775 RepID=F0BDK9_9XANT|nr:glycosyltransferase family 4 protein [Xanthomonas vesicatoria]APP74309.1 lipopolysaccharide biosynthesis protein [Xanthomonas vesicatoria ATCC 35937]EGD09512.1 UDP-N-acetylmuramyl pentapeptide phosphotransferase/UDP-N-acetylglucosamine-1-phosphate transferase [Xanthomonas vesicatoria ATCC 35937]KTF35179.1 lipopolysaccharide biosynthesis protein [Xanthomonas vesicatoria]KTF38603.1 lipopolysaccharide biosynthesis protein [Xanthomonas vesicatoria]MCC8556990.1 glycosyltransferase family 4 prote